MKPVDDKAFLIWWEGKFKNPPTRSAAYQGYLVARGFALDAWRECRDRIESSQSDPDRKANA